MGLAGLFCYLTDVSVSVVNGDWLRFTAMDGSTPKGWAAVQIETGTDWFPTRTLQISDGNGSVDLRWNCPPASGIMRPEWKTSKTGPLEWLWEFRVPSDPSNWCGASSWDNFKIHWRTGDWTLFDSGDAIDGDANGQGKAENVHIAATGGIDTNWWEAPFDWSGYYIHARTLYPTRTATASPRASRSRSGTQSPLPTPSLRFVRSLGARVTSNLRSYFRAASRRIERSFLSPTSRVKVTGKPGRTGVNLTSKFGKSGVAQIPVTRLGISDLDVEETGLDVATDGPLRVSSGIASEVAVSAGGRSDQLKDSQHAVTKLQPTDAVGSAPVRVSGRLMSGVIAATVGFLGSLHSEPNRFGALGVQGVVGIVVGSLALLALAVGLLIFLVRRCNSSSEEEEEGIVVEDRYVVPKDDVDCMSQLNPVFTEDSLSVETTVVREESRGLGFTME